MTGSEQQSKISKPVVNQLPLKGFHVPFKLPDSTREMTIEGMGDGRYRVHTRKRQPKQK